MPSFQYAARTSTGEKVTGTVEANDRRGAMVQVEHMGYIPVSVKEGGAAAPAAKRRARLAPRNRPPRLKTRELLNFTTELSDLLVSGMTLGNALNTLANRRTGRSGDKIIADLRDEIVRGSSLSEALAQQPRTFPNLYVSMIRAGEAGSAMNEVLGRLVEHFERMQELKEKVVMALVYPAIVMTMGAATLIFSMVYVIPKFKVVFEQLGETLPLPTRILIASSEWLARYGLIAAGIVAALVYMGNRGVQTSKGRLWWDGLKLKAPLIKGIIASSMFANFARTLGTLLLNGVPVLDALSIVERTVGNAVISAEIRNARDRVTDGTTISGPLAAGTVFPSMMTDMLSVGEHTGDMPGALAHIARRYENELDRNVKIFTTALEPILIVIIAVLVGFVAVSILMAVFNLTNGLNV